MATTTTTSSSTSSSTSTTSVDRGGISIIVNNYTRDDCIDRRSLIIDNVLTSQVDSCRFDILKYGTRCTFKPEIGQEVKVFNRGEKIFGGIIVKIEDMVDAYGMSRYKVLAEDYTRLMDRKLVIETYSGYTIKDIIDDIVSKYLSGFTTNNVSCEKVIDYIAFNYEQPSKCFQQLADLVGYDWYVDYDKDIHFFSKELNPAPFNLSDTAGNYIFKSLVIRKDSSQVKTVVYVRGGEYLADTITAEIVADGERIHFPTPYKMSGIGVAVSGTDRTVGVDYLNNPDDYDCLYNFNEKLIKFKETDKPSNGAIVKIWGRPYLPVIVKVRDADAINYFSTLEGGTGEYEYKIIDKSIKTKQGARERARAELDTYKSTISEGEFQTHRSGLKAGQRIRVQSASRDIDEYFIINRVKARMRTEDDLIYDVNLVTQKTFGIIEFLQKLLTDPNKSIEIKENEIVDKVEGIDEDISIAELIQVVSPESLEETLNLTENIRHNPFNPPDWVLAPYTVTGDSDTKRPFYLDISSYLY